MNFIGNIAWMLFGGFITALMYWIFGMFFDFPLRSENLFPLMNCDPGLAYQSGR